MTMIQKHGSEPQTLASLTATAVSSLSETTIPKSPITTADWCPTLDAYSIDLCAAAEAAASFIREMASDRPPRWLTYTGVAGCGKTMLAKQIFFEARKFNPGNIPIWRTGTGFYDESNRRPNCVWLDAAGFSKRMKEGEFDLPEYLKPDWIVCLDDLGASRDKSDFIADGLYRFCNARLGRWTLFTTNLTLNELADRIDQRVVSRLIRDRNVVCQITSGDYALR